MSLPQTADFKAIVLNNRPLIDVRAPIEFEKGRFHHAVNLPLMSDEERHLIGIRYKEKGNEEAIALGESLVSGVIKEERIEAWKQFIAQHPDALLYCFRGGQRSGISQQWLLDAGINITRLKGGYKAFRNFLMEESLRISEEVKTLIIGGRTGSGKTLLLKHCDNMIDLEGLANHRGSSFGRFVTPQPSQIDFENNLSYALIQHDEKRRKHLVIEHESHNIGRAFIPRVVYDNLMKGELIILETPLEKRVEITFDEYITIAQQQYQDELGDAGLQQWFDDMAASFDRIKKRIGSERYLELKALLTTAFETQLKGEGTQDHKLWIAPLLHEYYDPMYDYQIEKTSMNITFRGSEAEVLAYIKTKG